MKKGKGGGVKGDAYSSGMRGGEKRRSPAEPEPEVAPEVAGSAGDTTPAEAIDLASASGMRGAAAPVKKAQTTAARIATEMNPEPGGASQEEALSPVLEHELAQDGGMDLKIHVPAAAMGGKKGGMHAV